MGSPIYAFASHAVSLCSSMRGKTGEVPLAALPGEGGLFCLGVTEARSFHDAPTNLRVESTMLEQLTTRIFNDNLLLATVLTADKSDLAEDVRDWAAQIND